MRERLMKKITSGFKFLYIWEFFEDSSWELSLPESSAFTIVCSRTVGQSWPGWPTPQGHSYPHPTRSCISQRLLGDTARPWTLRGTHRERRQWPTSCWEESSYSTSLPFLWYEDLTSWIRKLFLQLSNFQPFLIPISVIFSCREFLKASMWGIKAELLGVPALQKIAM